MPRKTNIKYGTTKINICTCGVEAPGNTFTWAKLGGRMVLLCWDCTDKLHTKTLEDEKKHDN